MELKPIPSVILTDQELDRLPALAKQIILKQRELDDHVSAPVVSMNEYRELKADQRMLYRRALKVFSPESE